MDFKNKQINIIFFMILFAGAFEMLPAKEPLRFCSIKSATTDISELVMKEAYGKLGITFELLILPAERSLVTSNQGEKADGELYRRKGIDKEYTGLVMIPVAVSKLRSMVFVKNVSFTVNGWESLRPYRIGIIRGVKYTEEGTRGMNVFATSDNHVLFEHLNTGRIDAAIESNLDGISLIRKLNLEGIRMLEPPITEFNLYHYLHRKHAGLVPGLTQVLKEMESKGRIQAIYREYLVKNGLESEVR